ncbi:MAG TPA: hypothetical protein VJS43_10505 [Candidatus Acidoferrales bacterium]|nr:hypothetical protein [Candidatus Acidoferrales bacterium]
MDAVLIRYEVRGLPDVSEVPAPLHDLAVSNQVHAKVSCSGYAYKLPWDDVDAGKGRKAGAICVTAFRSGNAFWFSSFPPAEFVTHLQNDLKMNPEQFRRHVGERASESDYSFMEQMLNARTSEVSLMQSPNTADFFMWLLLLKAVAMPPADSGVHAIRIHDFHGFQFENRRKPRFQIEDNLYSNSGGVSVILFLKDRQSAARITQPQINRILDSIHQSNDHPRPLTTD